jgi:hypothetical protein
MSAQSKREKYRSDDAYRQRCIVRVKVRHQQRRSDPVYARLVHVRKKIVARRDSIEAYQLKLEKLDKDLMKLIAERDRLAARLKR